MKTPVEIKIRAEHIPHMRDASKQMQEPEVSSSVAEGFIGRTKDGIKLEFTQTFPDGVKLDTVINAFKTGNVSIEHVGTPYSALIFSEGKDITSFHNINGNGIQINITTSRLQNTLTPKGGELDISYSLSILGNFVEKSHLTFSVTPIKKLLS